MPVLWKSRLIILLKGTAQGNERTVALGTFCILLCSHVSLNRSLKVLEINITSAFSPPWNFTAHRGLHFIQACCQGKGEEQLTFESVIKVLSKLAKYTKDKSESIRCSVSVKISSRSSDDRGKGKFSISETWLQSKKIMFFPLDYTAFVMRM